jgi:hypothetical protein
MEKISKALVSVAIVMLLLATISGTLLYYQNVLNDKDSRISVLDSQVTNQSAEITDYKAKVSNLESQLANLTSSPKGKITDFTADMSWKNLGGVSLTFFFNVTVENISVEKITGVQVTVQRLNDQKSIASGHYQLVNLGTIEPREIRQVGLSMAFSLDKYSEYKASSYLAILTANGSTVLDEQRLY